MHRSLHNILLIGPVDCRLATLQSHPSLFQMPDSFRLEDDAPLRRVLYIAAVILIAIPTVQVVSQLWPLQLVSIQWRFGAANAFSAILMLPFMGVALLLNLARATDSRGFSRLIGATSGLIAVVLAASTVLFILDALQLKTIVQSRMLDQFTSTMYRVAILSTVFFIAFGILALSAFSFPKSNKAAQVKGAASKKADDGVGLIVGQTGARTE